MAADGIFISDRPQLAIARETAIFAALGLNDPSLVRIIYKIGDPFLSYIPTEEFNAIKGIEKGSSYLIYTNAFYDGSPALANAVLDNLIPQTSTNVFANQRTVFICTSSVDFVTAGITTSNIRLITLVNEGYFISYDPNDTSNGITGFVEGFIYYIDPLADIDLSVYGVTEIRYADEVVYLNDLEDVTITNSNPDATLPLDFEETLVRNTTTGIWENKKVSVKFYDDEASLPATGFEDIIYVAKAEGTSWYWDGAAYQPIGSGGGGSTPNLQEVTDVGSVTTNTISTEAGFRVIHDAGIDGNVAVLDVSTNGIDAGGVLSLKAFNDPFWAFLKPLDDYTADRTLFLPDKSGTIATLDDITGGGGSTPTIDDVLNTGNSSDMNINLQAGATNTAFNVTNTLSGAVAFMSADSGSGFFGFFNSTGWDTYVHNNNATTTRYLELPDQDGTLLAGGTPSSSTDNTVTHKIAVVIGGVTYYLMATTSPT